MKKKILLCVQRDILKPISWALRDLQTVSVLHVDHLYQLEKIIESEFDFCGLILDSQIDGESTLSVAQRIKSKKTVKILMIIPAGSSKQDVMDIIQNKLADSIIIRPFSANQIVEAVSKLCGIERPAEKPWYMYTQK